MIRTITVLLVFVSLNINLAAVAAENVQLDETVAWMLGCQGCHGANGRPLGDDIPALNNTVSRFLSIPGGREYLVRVPGVAMSPLGDVEIAQLTNWMLKTMDPEHIPDDFKEYSAKEVARLRRHPLGYEAADVRAQLIEQNVSLFDK